MIAARLEIDSNVKDQFTYLSPVERGGPWRSVAALPTGPVSPTADVIALRQAVERVE
ncbi:hypothetical protein [Paractinoplanes toevensis]|uniref:hypothetical protein n=1 Tax=Paractinoplanes toevensis TaxID=571911 RepID=UPI001BB40718|nr:hypothetical protein [Actinoplanes toevensis]